MIVKRNSVTDWLILNFVVFTSKVQINIYFFGILKLLRNHSLKYLTTYLHSLQIIVSIVHS